MKNELNVEEIKERIERRYIFGSGGGRFIDIRPMYQDLKQLIMEVERLRETEKDPTLP